MRESLTPMPDGKISHLVTYHEQNEYLEGQIKSMRTACGVAIKPEPPFPAGPRFVCVPCFKVELEEKQHA
jgi:hypothetical protein